MKKKSSIIRLSIIGVLLIVGLIFAFIPMNFGTTRYKSFAGAIKLGLDLKGGVYAVYEIDDYNNLDDPASKRDATITRLQKLLETKGYTEATVVKEGDRIRVEVPDVDDPSKIFDLIGKPATLKFVLDDGTVVLTGENVKKASVGTSQTSGQYVVQLSLDSAGASAFGTATANNIGKNMAIVVTVDGEDTTISNPTINAAITNGEAIIEGGFTQESAQELVDQITAGQFEVMLSLFESSSISPTLGQKALQLGIIAGIIAVILIMIFLCVIYRGMGLASSFTLLIYLFFMIFLLATIPGVQLTLPGLAGIILSFGMAVDAAIIIFERIKSEYKNGKSILASYYAGFKKAFWSIFDSNITTIIAAVILLIFGTGSIKGFAITLLIGIVLSMLTSIFLLRFVLKQVLNINSTNEKFYNLKRGEGYENLTADATDPALEAELKNKDKEKEYMTKTSQGGYADETV